MPRAGTKNFPARRPGREASPPRFKPGRARTRPRERCPQGRARAKKGGKNEKAQPLPLCPFVFKEGFAIVFPDLLCSITFYTRGPGFSRAFARLTFIFVQKASFCDKRRLYPHERHGRPLRPAALTPCRARPFPPLPPARTARSPGASPHRRCRFPRGSKDTPRSARRPIP